MEDMASLWSYQESIDELKQKLLYTTLELESERAKASEEMNKHKDYVKQSLQLLKITIQERDEARNQLDKLLNKIMIPSTQTLSTEFLPTLPQFPPESPLIKHTKANSSVTESNSFSENYKYHSQNSSPVDSFFDAVPSPELSNINNIVDSSNIAFVNQHFVPEIDQASLMIDNLVKGKTLPQKGKLLQSVLEAGPLLQTLLVAGLLPRWRNPPPLQTFNIPPVENVSQKPAENPNHVLRSMNSQSYVEMSCGSSQMLSTSMLNFGNGASGSCVGNGRLISAGTNSNNFVPNGKRQRFH